MKSKLRLLYKLCIPLLGIGSSSLFCLSLIALIDFVNDLLEHNSEFTFWSHKVGPLLQQSDKLLTGLGWRLGSSSKEWHEWCCWPWLNLIFSTKLCRSATTLLCIRLQVWSLTNSAWYLTDSTTIALRDGALIIFNKCLQLWHNFDLVLSHSGLDSFLKEFFVSGIKTFIGIAFSYLGGCLSTCWCGFLIRDIEPILDV